MKDFKVGEPVLFCDGWGITYNPDKLFRWGELRAGFITAIEVIEARDSALYTVSTVDERDSTAIRSKLLGEHLIFRLAEKDVALATVYKYCVEVT